MQVRTQDDAGRWFTPETLSARQRMTPEGFLLCEAVPIARTGTLIYDESEIPVEGGPGGLVTIERNADEVFRAETMASFEGKPVTLSHPDDFVNPSNWRQLSVGIVQNVRRGTDIESDLMLADLLITDAAAIAEVRGGLRQVSCGYDADYEQLAPGRGRQTNIVGNHVALVERGRCGPRCAIGDSDEMKTNDAAKPKARRTWKDKILTAFRAKDEAALEEALEEAETSDEESEEEKESGKTGDAASKLILKELRALSARVGDMEAKLEEESEETTDDVLEAENAEHNPAAGGETYTGDSAVLTDLRSRAEILVPGITFGTRDGKVKVADHICSCQRQALTKAMANDDGKAVVEPFLFGRSLDKLTADQVAAAFNGASELAKVRNNDKAARTASATRDFGKTKSIAEINAANRKHWQGQGNN
jgi:hypothetical protein